MKNWNHKSVKLLIKESNNDPEFEVRTRARNLVLMGLEKGWSGPPYSAIELAKLIGIEIEPNDSVDDARILPTKNNFKIEYNPFQKPTRINFSIAHELAHTLFSDCSNEIRNRETTQIMNRELEQLCNIGASEIQLPYAVFSEDANSIEEISLESLLSLASKYKASLESLFLRFIEVIDRPCSILICSFNESFELGIEYWKSSKTFDVKVPNNFIIPKDSKAYECSAPGWTSRETVNWSFLGNDYNIFCVGISPMRRDNRARVGIIITPKISDLNLNENRINIEFGDATKPRGKGIKIIAQIVNTTGGLGLGFGKSLSKNYPIIKTELQRWQENKQDFKLGKNKLFSVHEDIFVCQMLAQKGLFEKNGEIPLKYSSLRECLIDLQIQAENIGASIHMPMIGAGQAKGDWKIIKGIIHDELVSKGIPVFIYMLPGKVPNIKSKLSLTLFNEESTWVKEK